MSHLRDRLRVIAGFAPLRHVEAMLVLSEHLGIAEAQEKYPGLVEQAEVLPRYEDIPELELDGATPGDPRMFGDAGLLLRIGDRVRDWGINFGTVIDFGGCDSVKVEWDDCRDSSFVPASRLVQVEEPAQASNAPLPAIGTRVRIPVMFYRVAKVVAHKDGGVDVELPGDSKTLWVAAGDLEAEG